MTSDLDLLRARFAEIPEPDAGAWAAARRRLLDEIDRAAAPARRRRRRLSRRRLVVFALAAAIAVAVPITIGASELFREFPIPEDIREAEPVRVGPKHELANGQIGALRWRFVVYRAEHRGRSTTCDSVETGGIARSASGACGFPPFRGGVEVPGPTYLGQANTGERIDRSWLVGRVTPEAESVTLVLADGRTIEAKTYETPPSLNLPYAYYLAVVRGQIGGRGGVDLLEAIANDGRGAVIARCRTTPTTSPFCADEPAASRGSGSG